MCSQAGWEPQEGLFDEAPPVRRPRAARTPAPSVSSRLIRHRLATDVLVAHGWPAGTLLMVDPDRRAQRGDMVLVLDRNRRLVGRLDRELGRPAVRHGASTTWLVDLDQVMGVVVSAEAALVSVPTPGPAPDPLS